jgi:2-hydroxychromene-2-carboxylate isomerase
MSPNPQNPIMPAIVCFDPSLVAEFSGINLPRGGYRDKRSNPGAARQGKAWHGRPARVMLARFIFGGVPIMSGVIDFYFDFISPFSYLAHCRLPDLAARHGHAIAYHVVNLAVLKLEGGNTGPTTREMPLKYRYSGADMQRWAARYGVVIKRPSSHDPDRLNKGAFLAADRGVMSDYVTNVWRRVWGEGGDMAGEAILRGVAEGIGWDAEEYLAFTVGDEAEARYESATRAAHEAGVFGVPTMMIGAEIWWGNDRLDFVEEFLGAPEARTEP